MLRLGTTCGPEYLRLARAGHYGTRTLARTRGWKHGDSPTYCKGDQYWQTTAALGATLSRASQLVSIMWGVGTSWGGRQSYTKNGATWRRRGKIILSFPQILALSVQLFVCLHRNNGAARDSPREVWGVVHPEIHSQLREEGLCLLSCFEADRHADFSCQFSGDWRGEEIKQKKEILGEMFTVVLHISSAYFLPHLSLSSSWSPPREI